MTSTLTILLLGALTLAAPAQSVPPLVNYQGRLANPDGSPLPTGDYELRFRVYDAATGGSNVWGPQLFDAGVGAGHGPKIPVVQGYFNVMLGPVDTNGASLAGAFNGTNRYVEVTISNRPPIAPRQQILSAPFALKAQDSATLAGYDWSAVFGTNNPVAGTIPFSKLAQRQVGTNVGAGGIAISESVVYFAIGGPGQGELDIPSAVVTLQTTGRPVFVGLVSDSNGSGYVQLVHTAGDPTSEVVIRQDNAEDISRTEFRMNTGQTGSTIIMSQPASTVHAIALAGAGTHSYQLRGKVVLGELRFYRIRLVAFEL